MDCTEEGLLCDVYMRRGTNFQLENLKDVMDSIGCKIIEQLGFDKSEDYTHAIIQINEQLDIDVLIEAMEETNSH